MLAAKEQNVALDEYLGTLFSVSAVEATTSPQAALRQAQGLQRALQFRIGSMLFALPDEQVTTIIPLREVKFTGCEGLTEIARWQERAYSVINVLSVVVPADHPQRDVLLAQEHSEFMLVLDYISDDSQGYAILCDEWLGGFDLVPGRWCPHTEKSSYPWLMGTFADGSGALLNGEELAVIITAESGARG